MSLIEKTTACTTTFGRRCRNRIRQVGRPLARVLLLLGAQHLAPHDPAVRHPADHGDRHVDAARARPEREHQRDDQYKEREGDHDVDHPHHHEIEPAADPAGEQTQHGARDERGDHGQHTDLQVGPAAVEQPGQHVAAELVGAQQVPR
jgi:hypothetical protein